MSLPVRHRILAIEQLNTEWRTVGRCDLAVHVLHRLAEEDASFAALVHGPGPDGVGNAPPPCSTLWHVVEHMRRARGKRGREEAAALVRVMLREAHLDPLVVRCLVQALVPGLVTVAIRLRWGSGGDWEGASDFFSETLSTTWTVLSEWSGQDRPFAVLDVLSAVRCRMRRQLLRARDHQRSLVELTPALAEPRAACDETDLELLARTLIALHGEGMHHEDVEVLYGHHVLGFSIAELAATTGRDRRALYARRDRGHRRICA